MKFLFRRKSLLFFVFLLSMPSILYLKNGYVVQQDMIRMEQQINMETLSSSSKNVSTLRSVGENVNLNENMTRLEQQMSIETLSSRSKNVSTLCSVGDNLNPNKFVSKNRMFKKLPRDLLVMQDKRLAWCMVPKAASTSISTAIVKVNNQTSLLDDIHQTQVFLRKVYKKMNLEIFKKESANYISFYITRHPFNRIVSAYRNKLENSSVHDGAYFYNRYGKKIVTNYRNETQMGLLNNRREPTFQEFVDFLLHTKPQDYDLHWQPITIMCDVCNYNYNFTIKFENFRNEFQVLLNFLKEGKFIPPGFEIEWKNKGSHPPGKEERITRAYMKQIPKGYVRKLYQIYKADFEYFGYDSSEYF